MKNFFKNLLSVLAVVFTIILIYGSLGGDISFLFGKEKSSSASASVRYEQGHEQGYEEGYDDGYGDGRFDGYYNGYCDGYNDTSSEESEPTLKVSDDFLGLLSFRSAIAELMYDREYDTVRTLLEYNREGVEIALEKEFGTKDLSVIIDYIEGLSQTIIGYCEICGEPVYEYEITILPDDIECAHRQCIVSE